MSSMIVLHECLGSVLSIDSALVFIIHRGLLRKSTTIFHGQLDDSIAALSLWIVEVIGILQIFASQGSTFR